MALDAERPEHDSERQVERLEDGALLDVELEVGGRRLELRPRFERAVEIDSVLGERVRERDSVPVGQLAQLVLIRSSSLRPRSSRRGCGRIALPPRPPS